MPHFNDPFSAIRAAQESNEEDLFGDLGDDNEQEEQTQEEPETTSSTEEHTVLENELGEVNQNEEQNEEDADFTPNTTEPVETTVEVTQVDSAAATDGEAVAKAAGDVEELGERIVAVETYRAIAKTYGLTPGVGEAIRMGMESIHVSFGRTNVVPSLESIVSGESGVDTAADRSLSQTAERMKDLRTEALAELEEKVKQQYSSTKTFASEQLVKLDQLAQRLPGLKDDAMATLNLEGVAYLKADDALVATDPRHQDMLEDVLKDVYSNILKHVPKFITDVASTMRSCKDYNSLEEFAEALAKVGAKFPSLEGRRGSLICSLDYEVPAIRTNTLMGEASIVQYRGDKVCGKSFREVLSSFHYTYGLKFVEQDTADKSVETVLVPPVHELRELLEYLEKSCANVERLVDVDLFTNIVNEANVSVANYELDDVEKTQHSELIHSIVAGACDLMGRLGAHATRVISTSIAFIGECITALEEATARQKAGEEAED